MAYATSNPPACISEQIGGAGTVWLYRDGDDKAAVTAADYFSNGDALGMKAGDTLILQDETNTKSHTLTVSAVTAGGAATVSDSISQELTATGAVTPGVQSIELNHATVAVAATIADSLDHQGLFMVVNTSASGTAAHTVTLTSGTWNGTNAVATLNAPLEAFAVWFDSAGNGTILENVGVVAFSG